MTRFCTPVILILAGLLFSCKADEKVEQAARLQRMLDRASALELPTEYTPPPGDPQSHHAAGFAKIMCSAVFITGLDPDFAAESVGYFASPYEERSKVGKPVIDQVKKSVSVTLPNGVTRTAIYTGGQGCICLPAGVDTLYFKPKTIKSNLVIFDRE